MGQSTKGFIVKGCTALKDGWTANTLVGAYHLGTIHWNELSRERERQKASVTGTELVIAPCFDKYGCS